MESFAGGDLHTKTRVSFPKAISQPKTPRVGQPPAIWPTETSENPSLERPTNAVGGFYSLVFYSAI